MKTKIINIKKIITWNPESNSLDVLVDKEILIEDNIIIEIGNDFNNDNSSTK